MLISELIISSTVDWADIEHETPFCLLLLLIFAFSRLHLLFLLNMVFLLSFCLLVWFQWFTTPAWFSLELVLFYFYFITFFYRDYRIKKVSPFSCSSFSEIVALICSLVPLIRQSYSMFCIPAGFLFFLVTSSLFTFICYLPL